jgi:hypothetical protein
MLLKTATSLALATVCLTALATMPAHAAVASSPQQNVVQSQRYDRMLETNRAFRQARMRKECGPITDPELRQSCLSSFRQDEPYSGSSTPRHKTYHSGSGR